MIERGKILGVIGLPLEYVRRRVNERLGRRIVRSWNHHNWRLTDDADEVPVYQFELDEPITHDEFRSAMLS